MDRGTAQDWLDRYVAAWISYDRNDIAGLFGNGVVYRYHPDGEPVVGVEAVVESWIRDRDASGTYDARYTPVAVDDDVVVATGTSTYRETPDGAVTRTYDNCFVMRFDGEDRCIDFVEYYVRRGASSQE